MAAFDKICSGYPKMDNILDHIRLGDNVVWQVSKMKEFCLFAKPFARQAVQDGRNVIYVRFAQHAPLLNDMSGIKMYELNPDEGFEAFTVAIHKLIKEEGKEAFYVFDCLSELQSVWYTDLMMGNFFRVTCPYLFEMDTVAYFPLLRGRHSFDAVARIRDTTQLLLDVYSNEKYVYLHPLKVWNRYSDNMFLPHCYVKMTGEFSTVSDGVGMSRYYQTLQKLSVNAQDQNYDSYDRFFNMAKMDFARGRFDEETEDLIIGSTMTKDARLKQLVKKYFNPQDYFTLRDRMIGSGAIGGKACGMLLARKIAETEIPEYLEYNEPHDSFYIGSDVFYTYIVSNGGWRLRIRQRTEEGYFTAAKNLQNHLLTGEFPTKIREQFLNVLEYFGQSPFIVRSSSFLEDGFGNAFAGKYESVFCVNQGTPGERMQEFEEAVRKVYASTMDYSALEYRLLRGLQDKDEQMAVLVQRVSGSYYGKYFMPGAAGVGYSHSAYKWYPDMDPVLYYQYPYSKKYDAAAAIGEINRYYRGSGKKLLLMTPGRIGTSSPELGVPVSFGNISNFSAVCEISDNRAGYMPELSYGSHMFQDLVEAEILYGAIWNNEKTLCYNPDFLEEEKDRFSSICLKYPELAGMIRVKETENLYYWMDAVSNHGVCGSLNM
jgi:pyruvate,water dikinase